VTFGSPRNGRPRDYAVHEAARMARRFYDWWRKSNRKFGVRDRGFADEMKDLSVRYIIEDFFPELADDRARVRALMNREKARLDLD
jgi:hypothetical protein